MLKTQPKSLHYWAIHKRVMRRMWNDLSFRQRELIAFDTDQKSETFVRFTAGLNAEVERLYNDPTYYYNDPFTFRVSYHGD